MKQRVLITGMNGFTGRYLAATLQQAGHEVFGLNVDICDAQAVTDAVRAINPQWVAHLAGVSFVGHGNVENIYKVNILGSHHLLSALEKEASEVKNILLVSSAHVYGNHSTLYGIDENAALHPANDYAVSKLSVEYLSQLWQEKLPITIVRPFNYTGVGQDTFFIIPKIISHFVNKSPIIELGNVDVLREFNDVRSIVEIYMKLLNQDQAIGKIINVCSGKGYSLHQVLTMCEELTHHRIAVKINPKFVRQSEVKELIGNNQRLCDLIAEWKTYQLKETLAWMLRTDIH